MRVAVIGSSGQLGFDLMNALPAAGHQAVGFTGRAQLDINDATAVERMLEAYGPDAVINTAAFHNVDLCEKETAAAYATNVVAVRTLAAQCEKRGVPFVQVGTDYVVEGAPDNRPVSESAAVAPRSIYALTRFGGDCMTLAHAPRVGYVLRSCGLFGVAGCKLKGGLNFVDTMIAAAKAGKPLRVVNDQIVAPTPTDDLSQQLIKILERRPAPGLYHAVSHGQCSWFEFAREALKLSGIPHDIQGVPSAAYAAPARRPAYSVLDNAKLRALGMDIMGPWQESLQRYVRNKYPAVAMAEEQTGKEQ